MDDEPTGDPQPGTPIQPEEAPSAGVAQAGPDAEVPAAAGAPDPVRRGSSRIMTHLAALVTGGALALAVLFATGFLGNGGAPTTSPSPSPGEGAGPSATPTPPSALIDGRSLGPAGAPIRIDIWADFQCPFCGLQAKAVEPTMERELAATGRARITFRDYAFLGQESIGAAVAARCADQQDAFWTYHDLLFASQRGENQGAFRPEILVSLAQFANLDMDAFEACLVDPEIAGDVATETAEGRNLGITSTPTTVITGPYGEERLSGLTEFAELEAALNRVTDPDATPLPTVAPTAQPTEPPGPTPEASETPEASGTPEAGEAPSPSPTAS